MTVNVPVCPLFEKADNQSPLVDEAIFGDRCEIISTEGRFAKIKTDYDYEGYAELENLTESEQDANYTVCSRFSDLLVAPQYYERPVFALPFCAKIKIIGEPIYGGDRFYKVLMPTGEEYYIHKNSVRPLNESLNECEARERIVQSAKLFYSVRYRWGGKTGVGIDCSGLSYISYRSAGIKIYRDADTEKSKALSPIDEKDLKKGDLLFFTGHVAVYIGDGNFLHSYGRTGDVTVGSITEGNENYLPNLRESFEGACTAFLHK